MVIRRRAEKTNTLRPLRSALEVLFDDLRDNGLAILRIVVIVYVILALVALPLTAASLIPINKDSTFASNAAYIFAELIRFLKGTDIVVPGAGDYLLAGVVLLYHRTLRAPLAFFVAAGFMYLLTNYGLEPVANYFKALGANTSTAHLAFGLQYAYTALLLGIAVCSIFLPTIVASRLKRSSWVKYFFVNGLIGWFPPIWVLLLFLAFKPPKASVKTQAVAESADEQPISVKEREAESSPGKISTGQKETASKKNADAKDVSTSSRSTSSQNAAPPQKRERKNRKGFRKK